MSATSSHALVVAFDVFVFLGALLLSCIVFAAVFSRTVKRSIAWYSLMMAWVVYSLSYGLLVGRQEGPDPPRCLCLIQTILIYAVPPLTGAGMLCFYIEFSVLIFNLKSGKEAQPNPSRTFWLVATPWLVFLGIIIEVVLLIFPGGRLPHVERAVTDFYCHVADELPTRISAAVVSICMVAIISLEVWTGALMHRNWHAFKRLSKLDRRVVLSVYMRLLLCTLAAILTSALSTMAFIPSFTAVTLAYPTLPIFIALVFGTQRDLLLACLFWLPSQRQRGSRGAVLTTNILTSYGGGFTDVQQTQQTQQQQQKTTILAESAS